MTDPIKAVGHITLTPTWTGLLPLLVEVAASGATHEGRKEAWAELRRLASNMDKITAELNALRDRITAHDADMNDPHHDGTGTDAMPPDGDDYNDLFSDVTGTLDAILGTKKEG